MIKKVKRVSLLAAAIVFTVGIMSSCSDDENFDATENLESSTSDSALKSGEEDNDNKKPVAENDSVNPGMGETVVIDVLANDFDPDGDDLKITNVFGGSPHTFRVVGSKIYITRTAVAGAFIYYTTIDGNGGRDQGQVRIPLLGGNN